MRARPPDVKRDLALDTSGRFRGIERAVPEGAAAGNRSAAAQMASWHDRPS